MAEPFTTALLLTTLAVLLAASALLKPTFDRLGIPVVLLFLVLGMLGGSEGIGGIYFADYNVAVRLGIIALILILFDGGLNTSIATIRRSLVPASLLATVGVAATAVLVALAGRALGLGWAEAFLLGAVVSSTDAAAVFAVLRGSRLSLKPRLGSTLEFESCVNDPMAVILTLAIMSAIVGGEGSGFSAWRLLWEVPLQLGLGLACGIAFGYAGRFLLNRFPIPTPGLYPVLTLAGAFLSFGLATLINGSGFLSVFFTAVIVGNGPLPYRAGMIRVHDAIAWLSQVSMFLMLGLLVYPSRLPDAAWIGLPLALFLALVARPLATIPLLWPFGYTRREMGYAGWVGLRGAVPIILATFPVLAEVPGAERIFDIVFFVVVVSAIIPGATIRFLARKWNLQTVEIPAPQAVLEINSTRPLGGDLVSFLITPQLAVAGARFKDIPFPDGTAAVLLVRDGEVLACRGETELQPGDHIYIYCDSKERPYFELLFGRPEE
jgi:potassium/hydrogen antiporter